MSTNTHTFSFKIHFEEELDGLIYEILCDGVPYATIDATYAKKKDLIITLHERADTHGVSAGMRMVTLMWGEFEARGVFSDFELRVDIGALLK